MREFEIQGNIGTLNLNTESKLTIYGSGNIDWINYNSYTDLELYIDGRIGTLFVDNSYGKIDIGDYTYIDKVILPKDVSPNDIFDDFLDDKDNVGEITDPDGKPIDKDDNENQNPDDKTKPLISITELKILMVVRYKQISHQMKSVLTTILYVKRMQRHQIKVKWSTVFPTRT